MGSVWTERDQGRLRFSAALHALRAALTAAFAAAWGISCIPARLSIVPPPPSVETMEGYISFRLSSGGTVAKSRFSFVYTEQRLGRIEILDAFSRAVALILIENDRAACALPAEKVYWQGEWLTVSKKFLGSELSPAEVMALLSGRWSSSQGVFQTLGEAAAWTLHRNGRNLVSGGEKGDFAFTVKNFFQGSPVPRTLEFTHPAGGGRLTTLGLEFNKPAGKDAFRASFLEDVRYRPVSWEELEGLWKNES